MSNDSKIMIRSNNNDRQGQRAGAEVVVRTKTAHRDGTCQYCLLSIHAEQDELYPVQHSLCRLARAEQTLTCQPTTVLLPSPPSSSVRSSSSSSSSSTDDDAPPTGQKKKEKKKKETEKQQGKNHSQEQIDKQILWVHVKCAVTIFQRFDMDIKPPICRHWFRSAINSQLKHPKCPFDDECYFLHPSDLLTTMIIPSATATTTGKNDKDDDDDDDGTERSSLLPSSSSFGTTTPKGGGGGGGKVPVLSHRRTWGGRRRKLFKPTAAIFRHWLLETFGHDFLLQGEIPRRRTTIRDNEGGDDDENDDDEEEDGNIGSAIHTGTSREGTLEDHRRQEQHPKQQQVVGERRYVLDIAGGNGRLAFELENLSGIPTCVVDPRPLTLKKAYSKWKSGFYDKASKSSKLNRFLTHYDRNVIPNYPTHLRIFFDHDTLTERVLQYQKEEEKKMTKKNHHQQQQQPQADNSVKNDHNGIENNDEDDISWWTNRLEVARRKTWTPKGLEEERLKKGSYRSTPDTSSTSTAGAATMNKTQTPVDSRTVDRNDVEPDRGRTRNDDNWLDQLPADVQDGRTALSVLANCTMVVGMHPDQATEAAVDFALALNKPFAVVPCCVFSSHFPNRRLRGSDGKDGEGEGEGDGEHTGSTSKGTKVKTTSQLVQYLSEKDDRIRVETLPFEGMNQVVYMTPDQLR